MSSNFDFSNYTNRPLPPVPKKDSETPVSPKGKKPSSNKSLPKEVKEALTEGAGEAKQVIEKKWGEIKKSKKAKKLGKDIDSSITAAKYGLANMAEKVATKIGETSIAPKIAARVLKSETAGKYGRKAAIHQSGYKATLDKVPDDIKQEYLEAKAQRDAVELFDEPKWREGTKFSQTLSRIENAAHDAIENYRGSREYSSAAPAFRQECQDHLNKALGYLEDKIPCNNARERHLLYKKSLRKALQSDYYKFHSKNSPDNILVKTLNALSSAEFTGVELGQLTQELSEGRISTTLLGEEGKQLKELDPKEHPKELFQEAINPKRMKLVHASAHMEEEFGPQIRGEWYPLLDPLVQGNPANIKCRLKGADGKKEIVCVRTPTPTDGSGKITPEFKAFLRDLKAKGQKYTYVNLQSRGKAPVWKQLIGLDGEYMRCRSIEALSKDEEFRDVITVITLDKNSHFHHQSASKQDLLDGIKLLEAQWKPGRADILQKIHNIQGRLANKHEWSSLADEIAEAASKEGVADQLPAAIRQRSSEFIDGFMEELTSISSSFFLPDEWRKNPQEMRDKLNKVHELFYGGKEFLGPKERQDFVEIAYLFLTEWAVQKSGADFFHQGCKDNIDRGGGASWLMLSFMTYLKVASEEHRGTMSEADLKNMILSLPAKLEEDAIWARKRGMLDERFERAMSALHHIVNAMESNPGLVGKVVEEYGFKGVNFQTLSKV